PDPAPNTLLLFLQLVPLDLAVPLVARPVLEQLQEDRGAHVVGVDYSAALGPGLGRGQDHLALEAVEVELSDDLRDRDRILLVPDPLHHLARDQAPHDPDVVGRELVMATRRPTRPTSPPL